YLIFQMTTQDPHQFSSLDNINSEDITLPNEDELELNESTASDISENLDNLDAESNSSLPAQSTSHTSGVIVTNSLGKRIRKKKVISRTKRPKPGEKSWVWDYFKKNKLEKKVYFRVEITCEDGTEKPCNHNYKITTGTGNLKSHLRQIHRILPPEENNNQSIQ
ncbi:26189_t:CDS:1, partial [Gigaspora rosea]